jgi:hypothetical protein
MTQENYTSLLRENYKKMLLTKKETATELSISEATLDRLRTKGKITPKKVMGQIMFSVDEIARFLEEI